MSTNPPRRDKGASHPARMGAKISPYWSDLSREHGFEPLKIEVAHFVDCVLGRDEPLSNGRLGLEVVEILDKACQSIQGDGRPYELELSGV